METSQLHKLFLTHGSVSTDSRSISPGGIFFALKGERHDGNQHAAAALAAGASHAVVDQDQGPDPRLIRVADALRALQDLARFHRRHLGTPLLALTGSNGKTTTKELLAAVLARKFETLSTRGNLNNHIGVPLTLLRLAPGHQFAVVEMGANRPGDIRQLCEIAEPDMGLVTNVGKAHLKGFGGFDGVVRTKGEMYDFLKERGGLVFLNASNPLLAERLGPYEPARVLRYGSPEHPHPEARPGGAHLRAWHPELGEFQTQLAGAYNLENLSCALRVAAHMGIPAEQARLAFEQYRPDNHRSQIIGTGRNLVVMDAYNANPTSMAAALDNLAAQAWPRKAAVLGDMLELGPEEEAEHLEILRRLAGLRPDAAWLVGPLFGAHAAAFPGFAFHPDTGSLKRELAASPPKDLAILVKGSRGVRLESLLEQL